MAALLAYDLRYKVYDPSEGKLMNENLRNRCPSRDIHINLADRWEIEYWTKKFGVNEHDLRNAIQVVGTSANRVSEQLKH